MNLKHLIFFLLIVIGTFQLVAQEPAKYILGEKQLSNTDIYTVHTSQKNQLIIGTNQGVFIYGYNSFIPLKSDPKIKGNSFLGLTENSKGDVFCNTIYGSVCKIAGDSLILYCQVDKKHLSPSVVVAFNQKDELIFSSKSILKIKDNGTIEVIDSNSVYGSVLFIGPHHEIFGSTNVVDSMFDLSGGMPGKVKINISGRTEYFKKGYGLFYHRLIKLDGKMICPLKTHFGVDSGMVSKIAKEKNEDYEASNDGKTLWGRSSKEGIRKIYIKGNELIADAPLFKNTFISVVHQAKDGTLFLGTFGQGVWVVPNLNSSQYSLENDQGILQKIISVKNGVYAVTNKKECIKLSNDKLNVIDKKAPVAFLSDTYPHPPYNEQNGKFSEFYLEYIIPQYRLQTIKAFWYQDSNFFIATTRGIVSMGSYTDGKKSWLLPKNMSQSNLARNNKYFDKLKQRINSICFANNQIYAGTEASLYKIDKEGNMQELLWNDKRIISNHLNAKDGVVYCATENFGILKIEGKNVSTLQNIPTQPYLKTTPWQDQLLVQSKEGKLFLHDIQQGTMKFLGINEGVYGYVNDYDVFENELSYIFNSKSVGQTDLTRFKNKAFQFDIAIDSVLVNEVNTNYVSLSDLTYKQNRLQVFAQVKDLNLRQDALIMYRLKGLDDKWYELPKEENKIAFKSLVPGDYTLEIKGTYGNINSELIKVPVSISAPFWKTIWFYALATLVILGLAVLLFTTRIRKIKEQGQQKLEKQKLMTDLIDSQLTALRSQMNPHFIFNSLNSIQDLILQEKTEASYDYIVLFADLVRDTLNYSNMSFIPIEKEINFLETYLKLEKLRFGDLFEYNIRSNATEEVDVPSLIVQPFIENALLHGLLHKEGLRKLDITFNYTDKLICSVRDNGIGRNKSAEIKARQGGAHQSFALQAIEKRLSILDSQDGIDIGFTIHDLFENGSAAGTEVVIVMPFKTRF